MKTDPSLNVQPTNDTVKERLYHIIFESDTPSGKAFDVALLIAILLSILVVMLESVQNIANRYGTIIRAMEWSFTTLFTIEYALRIYCARNRRGYLISFCSGYFACLNFIIFWVKPKYWVLHCGRALPRSPFLLVRSLP